MAMNEGKKEIDEDYSDLMPKKKSGGTAVKKAKLEHPSSKIIDKHRREVVTTKLESQKAQKLREMEAGYRAEAEYIPNAPVSSVQAIHKALIELTETFVTERDILTKKYHSRVKKMQFRLSQVESTQDPNRNPGLEYQGRVRPRMPEEVVREIRNSAYSILHPTHGDFEVITLAEKFIDVLPEFILNVESKQRDREPDLNKLKEEMTQKTKELETRVTEKYTTREKTALASKPPPKVEARWGVIEIGFVPKGVPILTYTRNHLFLLNLCNYLLKTREEEIIDLASIPFGLLMERSMINTTYILNQVASKDQAGVLEVANLLSFFETLDEKPDICIESTMVGNLDTGESFSKGPDWIHPKNFFRFMANGRKRCHILTIRTLSFCLFFMCECAYVYDQRALPEDKNRSAFYKFDSPDKLALFFVSLKQYKQNDFVLITLTDKINQIG
jgi:hypothetical protein